MPTLVLTRVVRDNLGKYHRPPEIVNLKSEIRRAYFDVRKVVNVIFLDGSVGAVFSDEIEYHD